VIALSRRLGFSRWWALACLLDSLLAPLVTLYVMALRGWPDAALNETARRPARHRAEGDAGPVAGDHADVVALLDRLSFFDAEDKPVRSRLRAEVQEDGARALYRSLRLHMIDPEDMAEGGIGRALLLVGRSAGCRGLALDDFSAEGPDETGYTVTLNGRRHSVYGADDMERGVDHLWERSLECFVRMINAALPGNSEDRLYVFGSGNDAFAIFLHPDIAHAMSRAAPRPSDRLRTF
jgi:hypothetical protein